MRVRGNVRVALNPLRCGAALSPTAESNDGDGKTMDGKKMEAGDVRMPPLAITLVQPRNTRNTDGQRPVYSAPSRLLADTGAALFGF
jgi:hypothetical protein